MKEDKQAKQILLWAILSCTLFGLWMWNVFAGLFLFAVFITVIGALGALLPDSPHGE